MEEKKFRACSVAGCDRNAHGSVKGCRGFCNRHYQRLIKHGDPCGGSTAKGAVSAFLDSLSLHSVSDDRCIFWPYAPHSGGKYGKIQVNGKSEYPRQILCERVRGKKPSAKHRVVNTCGNGPAGCINPWHIIWAIGSDIERYKVRHGRSSRGPRNGMSRLSEVDVVAIRSRLESSTKTQIAKDYGVSLQTISNIANGKTWSWLLSPPL